MELFLSEKKARKHPDYELLKDEGDIEEEDEPDELDLNNLDPDPHFFEENDPTNPEKIK